MIQASPALVPAMTKYDGAIKCSFISASFASSNVFFSSRVCNMQKLKKMNQNSSLKNLSCLEKGI